MPEVQITCMSCKKKSPMSLMRYSKDGESLICQVCAGGSPQKPGMHAASRTGVPAASPRGGMPTQPRSGVPARQPLTGMPLATPAPPAPKPIRYTCTSCNYKFSRSSKTEIVCPYCNRKSLRKEFQLISNVDDMVGNIDTY